MKNDKKILTLLTDNEAQLNAIKTEIKKLFENMPDNPKIKRLGGGAFVIKAKELSPDLKLSPFYYDFKLQYAKILEILDDKGADRCVKAIQFILKHGAAYHKGETISFNPDVIKNIKEALI